MQSIPTLEIGISPIWIESRDYLRILNSPYQVSGYDATKAKFMFGGGYITIDPSGNVIVNSPGTINVTGTGAINVTSTSTITISGSTVAINP